MHHGARRIAGARAPRALQLHQQTSASPVLHSPAYVFAPPPPTHTRCTHHGGVPAAAAAAPRPVPCHAASRPMSSAALAQHKQRQQPPGCAPAWCTLAPQPLAPQHSCPQSCYWAAPGVCGERGCCRSQRQRWAAVKAGSGWQLQMWPSSPGRGAYEQGAEGSEKGCLRTLIGIVAPLRRE